MGRGDDEEDAAPRSVSSAAQSARKRAIHPANIYAHDNPDFLALARAHPSLAPFVSVRHGKAHLDFKSWDATRELARALLMQDFGLHGWQLPAGHLVPTIPNRLNYIHWVNDLLQLSSRSESGKATGMDVGCGANLIYPLLGASVYGWRFVAVDITPEAIAGARRNLDLNVHLAGLIEIRSNGAPADEEAAADVGASSDVSAAAPVPDSAVDSASPGSPQRQQILARHEAAGALPQAQQPAACVPAQRGDARADDGAHASQAARILGPAVRSGETFDFCMCNPPFFESIEYANKNPDTACGGTSAEMVCRGGEEAFVRQMILDSQSLRGAFHWYTSMLGKKSTLKAVRKLLHALPITALRTNELVQGRTTRWAVAWSFSVPKVLSTTPLRKASAAAPNQKRPRV